MKPVSTFLRVWLSLCLLGMTGCGTVKSVLGIPEQIALGVTQGKKARQEADIVVIQQDLLRFADEFSAGIIAALDRFQQDSNALSQAKMLEKKIRLGTEVYAIATGPNAFANVLDMTVFVTMVREFVENQWTAEVYGESVLPVHENCRQAETNIWRINSAMLEPTQQMELRQAITAWRLQNPLQSVLGSRALGFADQLAQINPTAARSPGSVFSFLRLDPLASLDPATREIAQTRLLAERALSLAQKMPTLLRWQTELLTLNALGAPELQQLMTNSTSFTESLRHLTRTAEQLPERISAERAELVKALEAQAGKLTPLLEQATAGLEAGSRMSSSLNTTLLTLDSVMSHISPPETNTTLSPKKDIEPFRIRDYTEAAAQLDATAQRLTELLLALDQTIRPTNLAGISSHANSLIQRTHVGAGQIVDRVFWRAVLLVGVVVAGGLLYSYLKPPRTRV